MPSPFPGMDPYLEGHLWPDVHQALASKLRQQLAPLVRPRYIVRLAVYVVEDTTPEGEIGIMYPDVEVIKARPRRPSPLEAPGGMAEAETTARRTTASLTIPLPQVRLATVAIRDVAHNRHYRV